jgi:hypothetical protein
MTARSVHIAVDVSVDGEEISGQASDGVGDPRRFSGWLGLISALDALLTSHTTETEGRDAGA